MAEAVQKVFYETRVHITSPFAQTCPSLPQGESANGKGSLSWLLPVRGINQLKEKWMEFRRPRKLSNPISLYVSPGGVLVAVASWNHITILRKADDYKEPFGTFTASSSGSIISGLWAESQDVLGLVADDGTLSFIRPNGEEIARVTSRHFKVSSTILGFIKDDTALQDSQWCKFNLLTSDGFLHLIEVNREPYASRNVSCAVAVRRQFPQNVFCFDNVPDHSLFVVVGIGVASSISVNRTSGCAYLSLWGKGQNSEPHLLHTIQFEGFASEVKDKQITYPKLLISPQTTYVAALDMMGCLHVFEFTKGRQSVQRLCKDGSDAQSEDILNDAADFTWWSDHILAIVKKRGNVCMFNILTRLELQEDDTVYSMPIVERLKNSKGNLFLLERSFAPFDSEGNKHKLQFHEQDNAAVVYQCKNPMMWWRLLSFSEKSIPEMYNILIQSGNYEAALGYAHSYGLDEDEVLKAQWLQSGQGVNEIKTVLASIKDKDFVLSECMNRVGLTEDSMRALLAYGLHLTDCYRFCESEDQESDKVWEFRMARLKLLMYSDMLETYLGISMGRFSSLEYSKFRTLPIKETAIALAESGKIGALNLLFKRHSFSLVSFMLEVLAAIPETVPVQSYAQLLPGTCPLSGVALREGDWVECERMIKFMGKLPVEQDLGPQIRTELISRRSMESGWPLRNELAIWYRHRAIEIDSHSGQLDNSLCLVELACRKGIYELQKFREDILYLHQVIYAEEAGEALCSMKLAAWEQLSAYEKFETMLVGAKEENVVKKLRDIAIPFMHQRPTTAEDQKDSFLVKWLKGVAKRNNLDICSTVLEEAYGNCHNVELQSNYFFQSEIEAIECALECIYLCTRTDSWGTMATILSKLPQVQDAGILIFELEKRYKVAEGHVEAGRLLTLYQVPKPISFFLEAHSDEKVVKQILRLMLSKFVRRQPGRSDNDWACLWRDLLYLRDKAFPFLDLEYMLLEFCRGLLKAGKFSLARNYLKGTGSVALPFEKAEMLVIQASRDYFFSASSLASEEIWKARECLNLFPSSRAVKVEADIIDAVTVKLPDLGLSLLPVQFRQIKDPMEIIKMAITGQAGAYLHVDELIEVGKLLGLNSSEDISYVEEAIAREAAVVGDLQLAFDLCLALSKKAHGPVWDLCAALARGPSLEQMNIDSRKQLLGFALAHCDEESISELLHAWKDLDTQGQCESLAIITGISPEACAQGPLGFAYSGHNGQHVGGLSSYTQMDSGANDDEEQLSSVRSALLAVVKNLSLGNIADCESILKENGKLFSFAALELPWLLALSRNQDHDKRVLSDVVPPKEFASVKSSAITTILTWLARNGFAPRDDLIALLAKSIIEPPVTEEEDLMACSFLLNLVDAYSAVEVIEEQLNLRDSYQGIRSVMSLGMKYSLLHSSGVECVGPGKRRELLQKNFKDKSLALLSGDEAGKIEKVQPTFWREWKLKLEEKMQAADRSRVLEQIIPGVETERFLAGDFKYIESAVFSLIESVKWERKLILQDVLTLADSYGLKRSEVILRYITSILASEVWTNEDIRAEISKVEAEIFSFASEFIDTVSTVIYPAINGCDKNRLACIYGLLSDCYLHLAESNALCLKQQQHDQQFESKKLSHLYRTLEHECKRVYFVKDLNFKNIGGLGVLNLRNFSNEVYAHTDESNMEALAKLVEVLLNTFPNQLPEGIVSWQDVYKHYITGLLDSLEDKIDLITDSHEYFQEFIEQLERIHDRCKAYLGLLEPSEALNIMKCFFTVFIPRHASNVCVPDNAAWQESLILLLNFWNVLAEEMKELIPLHSSSNGHGYNPVFTKICLQILMRLITDDSISPSQAWTTIFGYLSYGLQGDWAIEVLGFCRAMVFSGSGFRAISKMLSEAVSQCTSGSTLISVHELEDLSQLYSSILEPILQNMISGSLENHNLYPLLSSLSNLEGDLEELKKVRSVVWRKLAGFSENLQLPSQARVFCLELMQFISGKNIKGISSELKLKVIPWEGWDDLLSAGSANTMTDAGMVDTSDNSNRFKNTLIALRSSHLAAVISSEAEITSDDLLTIDTAVSSFLRLSAAASSGAHIDALLGILEEWEGLFITKKSEDLASADLPDPIGDWGNDDWDEGWETLQEVELPLQKEKQEVSHLVHPLCSCWLEIFMKLIALSRSGDVVRLLDLSLSKYNEVLINENQAESLCQTLLEPDCLLALKISLLLPFGAVRLMCLNALEERLLQRSILDITGSDHEFLIPVLYSGIISMLISERSVYKSVFSYLCFLVGNLCGKFQEAQVSSLKEKPSSTLFRGLLFPYFISELVKSEQLILAGFMVTKFMQTNPSFGLINVAEASLRAFLERHLRSLEHGIILVDDSGKETMKNVVSSLRDEMGKSIRLALSVLSR